MLRKEINYAGLMTSWNKVILTEQKGDKDGFRMIVDQPEKIVHCAFEI